jgi:hypothetical protein
MYENCAIEHPRESYRTRIELEEQIGRGLQCKPEKTTIRKNRKSSLVKETPRKKQFQCRTSVGGTDMEVAAAHRIAV